MKRCASLAILVADHRTGEILASVGSPDWTDASRSGFIDSGTLTGFLPDDAIPGLLMEHELAAELLPRQPH